MGRDDHRLESFEEYYGITPARVATEVYRKLVNVAGLGHADAEDITQETLVSMVKILQKTEREPVSSGRAFAFRVAQRRLQDFWRKKERLPVPTVDDVLTHLGESKDQPGSVNADLPYLKQLGEGLISELSPPLHAVAVLLWNSDDLSFDAIPQKEVAIRLGISVNTVKSRLRLIKKEFTKRLGARRGGVDISGETSAKDH